jgi:hypothetical protein
MTADDDDMLEQAEGLDSDEVRASGEMASQTLALSAGVSVGGVLARLQGRVCGSRAD